MIFNFTSRHQFEVKRYIANYGDDCAATYSAAYNANNADIVISNPTGYIVIGQSYIPEKFRICRGLCFYDLSGLAGTVEDAILASEGAWVTKDSGIIAQVYDGTYISTGVAGYGQIGDLTTVLGFGSIPDLGGVDEYYPFEIVFNSAGLTFLAGKAGGIVKLAFKVDTEGSEVGNCPLSSGYEEFFLDNEQARHKLIINLPKGYIWVEGTQFAYLDSSGRKRVTEGGLPGGTGLNPGYLWIQSDYLYYIDSSGAKRRILGSTTGTSGLTPGYLWIEGSYVHYTDADGDERRFAGGLV